MARTFGDRDPNLDRWYHHYKRRGERRKYWDYRVEVVHDMNPGHKITFYFGNRRMAQLAILKLSCDQSILPS